MSEAAQPATAADFKRRLDEIRARAKRLMPQTEAVARQKLLGQTDASAPQTMSARTYGPSSLVAVRLKQA